MPSASSKKCAREAVRGGNLPRSPRLQDLAGWSIKQLPPVLRRRLQTGAPGVLRVGTLCSGTDVPVPVLRALAKACRGRLTIEHSFSCEFDKRKQVWIRENFPHLTRLYSDVKEVGTGRALNVLTGLVEEVPAVDIIIAGFVCKSVSTENGYRPEFGRCIEEAKGSTGETFSGTQNYVRRFRPAMVICENVEGLVKANQGNEPQIFAVQKAFQEMQYSFNFRVLDTRDFHLPQRRRRCWMWAFEGRDAATQLAVKEVSTTIELLKSPKPFKISDLAKVGAKKSGPAKLNPRQQRVVGTALKKLKAAGKEIPRDTVVDVAKSEQRAPVCLGAAPCIVPNSLPFVVGEGRVLSASEVLAAQGVFQEDFPRLHEFAAAKPNLVRDLAGNAFSSSVCLAVATSVLSHRVASKKRKIA